MSERLDTAARRLIDKKEAKEAADKAAKSANAAFRAEEADFYRMLEEEHGAKTVTLTLGEGYGDVQFQRRETYRCIVNDKDLAKKSIVEMNLDDELLGDFELRLRPANARVKNWVKSGQPIPAGLDFNVTRGVTISRK